METGSAVLAAPAASRFVFPISIPAGQRGAAEPPRSVNSLGRVAAAGSRRNTRAEYCCHEIGGSSAAAGTFGARMPAATRRLTGEAHPDGAVSGAARGRMVTAGRAAAGDPPRAGQVDHRIRRSRGLWRRNAQSPDRCRIPRSSERVPERRGPTLSQVAMGRMMRCAKAVGAQDGPTPVSGHRHMSRRGAWNGGVRPDSLPTDPGAPRPAARGVGPARLGDSRPGVTGADRRAPHTDSPNREPAS